ncbi:MAG: polyphosphate kinase 2 family protein [Elusimicrobia bacterium]|nr:polyphosphate kinase 2 family protein [Elusimicrobiota bacterium]
MVRGFLLLAVSAQAFGAAAPMRLSNPGLPLSRPQVGAIGASIVVPSAPGLKSTLALAPSLAPAMPVLAPVPQLKLAPALAAPAAPEAVPAAMPALQSLADQVQVRKDGADSKAMGEFYDRAGRGSDAVEAVAAEGDFGAPFRVPYDPKGQVDPAELGPNRTPGMKHEKDKAKDRLEDDQREMDELQQKLYAEGKRSVLIVIQAMDTGGKDGTIRWVLTGLNPQGVKVSSFKKPTAQEAKHSFLWRIKKALPGKGMIGVFNRSHYEDILVPTVYKTFSAEEVAKRYDTINAFEKKLAENGTVILKFFLNISKDEQKARLQERLDDPDKNWKFSEADLETRKHWDEFQRAYGQVLARTSTPWAPWHVIPANKKWYRNYAVARIIKEAMQRMDPRYPKVSFDPRTVVIPD